MFYRKILHICSMIDMCYSKCIPNYKDTELNVAELSCTDRCIAKYVEAQKIVGVKMNEINERQAQLANLTG